MNWGSPMLSKKHHIFEGYRSLCGKWLYRPDPQPVKPEKIEPRAGDCKECVRRFNKNLGK